MKSSVFLVCLPDKCRHTIDNKPASILKIQQKRTGDADASPDLLAVSRISACASGYETDGRSSLGLVLSRRRQRMKGKHEYRSVKSLPRS